MDIGVGLEVATPRWFVRQFSMRDLAHTIPTYSSYIHCNMILVKERMHIMEVLQ